MTVSEMIERISNIGGEFSFIYDEELDGWFGWGVTGDVLEVTFDDNDGNTTTHQWRIAAIT